MADRDNAHHLSDARVADLAAAPAEGHPAPDAEHLDTCDRCRRAVEDTRRVLRALAEPVALEDPPPGLWEGIRDALGQSEDQEPAPDPSRRARRRAAGGRARRTPGVSLLQAPRRRPRWPLAAAAAAGVAVGAGGVSLVAGLWSDPDDGGGSGPAPQLPVAVGEAVLEPATPEALRGTARMEASPDGGQQLEVSVSQVPQEGYFEVWLRDDAASRLISLGTVSGQQASLPVPEGVDLDRFPVVDVSQEQFDGDPAHSGVTLAAGPMIPIEDDTVSP